MADHGQEMIRTAAATPAPMYNGAATTSSGVPAVTRGGDHWWSTAVVPPVPTLCSAPEIPGFNAWSAESPRSNSIATGSSITFQEPAGVADPATIAAGWNQPFLDGSGLSGYMSSRSDQDHGNARSLISPSSSNNNSSTMMLQLQDHHHDQNYQFLSTLGFELLSSPGASPYGVNSRSSSLLRSLTEPSAAGKLNSPAAFQRYQAPATCQAAATSINGSNAPFWNPSTGFDSAAYAARLEGPPPAPQSRLASLATKNASEEVGDSTSIPTKKTSTSGTTPPPKKKKTETQPSPLPTFKVRKEKLGDRVTALQQLVSPFGKTDTASVLHETIEYIKFLHDQVGAHSAPYLKNRQQVPHSKSSFMNRDEAVAEKGDLTGRGLCLVPISSTFAVASETPVVDFWNPFGAVFR